MSLKKGSRSRGERSAHDALDPDAVDPVTAAPILVVRYEQIIPVNVPDFRGLEAVTKDASD